MDVQWLKVEGNTAWFIGQVTSVTVTGTNPLIDVGHWILYKVADDGEPGIGVDNIWGEDLTVGDPITYTAIAFNRVFIGGDPLGGPFVLTGGNVQVQLNPTGFDSLRRPQRTRRFSVVFPRLSTSAFVPRGVNTLVVLTVVRHLPSIATPYDRGGRCRREAVVLRLRRQERESWFRRQSAKSAKPAWGSELWRGPITRSRSAVGQPGQWLPTLGALVCTFALRGGSKTLGG